MYSNDSVERYYEHVLEAIENGDDWFSKCGLTCFNLAFFGAAFRGDVEFLKLMKDRWGDVDFIQRIDFDRAIEFAAESGHIEIVKLMKQWGLEILTKQWLAQPKTVMLK